MKRHEPRITRIIFRDAKSNMSTGEYHIWKLKWDKFWAKLIAEARQQIAEDRKKGIKFKHIPKSELVSRSFEMAKQLDINLPKSYRRLYYDDVYLIEGQLEFELKLKNWEKEGCEVIFEPPRPPSSDTIAKMVKKAIMHKAKRLRFFTDW